MKIPTAKEFHAAREAAEKAVEAFLEWRCSLGVKDSYDPSNISVTDVSWMISEDGDSRWLITIEGTSSLSAWELRAFVSMRLTELNIPALVVTEL